jgi:hypothetical protein
VAKAEARPLSKESFDNNADLLVFPDRHEYRTRSRLGYFGVGLFALFGMALSLWGCLFLLEISAWPVQPIFTGDRTVGYVVTPIFLPAAVVFLVMALGWFRTNPWIIIRPIGVEFHNRLEFMHLRAQTFLVEFSDIEKVEMNTFADKGRYEAEANKFKYALKLITSDRGGLLLRWNTYRRDEAVRFADAFMASLQEMAGRSSDSP